MIFVTLGTQDKSFKRLLDAISKQIDLGNINDEVIVQAGYTKYVNPKMKIFSFLNSKDWQDYISKCDILITHGGVGSIIEGLKMGKKIIAAPRLKQYNEHTNDHQLDIVNKLANDKKIIYMRDFDKLKDYIKDAKKLKSTKYISNTKNIIKIIDDFILSK